MTDFELETGWAALDWTARLPLLGVPELALLLDLDERDAASLLSELRGGGWLLAVQASSPELELGRLHAVSDGGAQGLAAAFKLSAGEFGASFATGEREIEGRRARVEITAGVNRLAAEIVAAARGERGLDIKDVRALPARRPASAWWPPGVEAFGCLQADSARAPFFLAWDRAGASRFHRGQRISAWAAFRDSQQPWGYQGMPAILVLCPGPAEACQWEQAVLNSADRRLAEPLPVLLAEADAVWGADPLEAVWRRPGDASEARLTDLLNWRRTLPSEVAFPEFALPYHPLEPVGASGDQRSGSLPAGADEIELLRWLGAHPLLTADELKVLLARRGHDAARLLTRLAGKGLVDCVARPLQGERTVEPRYFLTAEGLELLAGRDGVPPRRYLKHGALAAAAPGWRGAGRLETLLRQLEHTAGVNGFAARFINDARIRRLAVAEWLGSGTGAEHFSAGGVAHWLRPDAVLRLGRDGRPLRLYLEWDRGTVSWTETEAKLQAYAAYFASGVAAEAALLVVTSTASREAGLRRRLDDLLPRADAPLLTSTAALVAAHGPFGAAWRAGPEERRRALLDALTPEATRP